MRETTPQQSFDRERSEYTPMPTLSEIPLYRAAQVREFDRRAIVDTGIDGYALMTRAAAAALRQLRQQWPNARRLCVVCGAGNNAGDGYVLARLAQAEGLDVRVGFLSDPAALRDAAQTAWADAQAAHVVAAPFTAELLHEADVIVDALLGTGLDRPLNGAWLDAVRAINAAAAPVLAVDIPSGLHADTGAVLGAAVTAAVTITFIADKAGLHTGYGPDHVGRVRVAALDVPDAVRADTVPAAWRLAPEWLRTVVPGRRARTAHKGTFGHVLVIGGQPGMSGAARLAAEAAARVGAGWVSVVTHPTHAAVLNQGRPELMVHGSGGAGELTEVLQRASVLAVGPGLGQGDWARDLLIKTWDSGLPLVVDADALNLLAQEPFRRDDWILTPHPGEAARLLRCTPAEVQADRYAAVHALQLRYGGVIVLKGAGTLVADGSRCHVVTAGNPGMASGGMGDVLTGVIAGCCAQGLSLSTAAAAGALMHALAGDAAAAADGERGLLAADLLPELRRLANIAV